ncbi:ATP-binding protein [Streptomyces olivochromogenes]|uniref:ATPase AAA n=1 Tax=Streptomyces olivochromogenes TaxID=1963 RepID=A0A250VB56_STROL|nr:ATP-binding protein [Streptomyces olivochromogenes]KUN46480.1 AAA family ATPase [Streptomyces olivochromogenes]GAX51391.1 ATPase AAA [Streptomyces olivochromogenes]
MDPNNRGPEEYGHDDDGQAPRSRPPRDALTADLGQHTPALARTVQLVSGDFLLTVNPVDGSEIEACPPGERPQRPTKFSAAERADLARAALPPVPPGPAQPRLPLLERQEERERLVRLLARGRSVRLTGPAGSGRTSLLDAVADDCADLAPDGVVRLSGYRRTATDLLYDLFAAVYNAPLHRPERDELLELVHGIGAVVVLDDVEIGGTALDELLDATPECAFAIAATPDVPAPSADSLLEEVFLGGLDRSGGLELLERTVGRVLTEEEANWAGDLWFESEGLPLRFMQAGALLRQRDQLQAKENAFDDFGVFQDAPVDLPVDAPFEAADGHDVPLPSLAEGAAPAALLASRLSGSARATLRFAIALGGEVPHQTHLPALVDDTHADAALAELAGCALVSPVGSRYRLAAGVQAQLEAAGYADGLEEQARTAAQHYTWWAGHPSVTPERVCAEADAVLAALTLLVPLTTAPADEQDESVAVQLARTASPAFAAGLNWNAWERALRSGAEASRLAGEVGEQAYFHHELGILALCGGQLDRARAELESSIGLRAALADKRGTVAGRRALALVADRSGAVLPGGRTAAGEEVPDARHEESASPPGGVPAAFVLSAPVGEPSTLVTNRAEPGPASKRVGVGVGSRLVAGTRRNLVAAGAGALLVAVLGTVVTLGATSNNNTDNPSEKVGVNPSASQGGQDDSLGADKAKKGGGGGNDAGVVTTPTDPGPDGTYGTSDDPTPPASTSERPSDSPSGTKGSGGTSTSPSKSPSKSPTTKPSSSSTSKPPTSPSSSVSPTDPSPSTSTSAPTTTPTTPPSTTTSASGPASSVPASTTASAPQSSSVSGPASSSAAGSSGGSVI